MKLSISITEIVIETFIMNHNPEDTFAADQAMCTYKLTMIICTCIEPSARALSTGTHRYTCKARTVSVNKVWQVICITQRLSRL